MTDTNKERQLEIYAVIITGLLKFILLDWLDFRMFYIVAACLFWLIYIYRKYRKNSYILRSWGFQKVHLKQSFFILLPVALITITGIVIYGIKINARFLNWHIIPIFVMYPVWGIIQQFMIIGLIAGNLKEMTNIKITEWQIILLTSSLFALVHYPSIPLMIYAFVMEVVFIRVYFKWKNLWTQGLYHGWVSGFFIFFVLGRDLWNELWQFFS